MNINQNLQKRRKLPITIIFTIFLLAISFIASGFATANIRGNKYTNNHHTAWEQLTDQWHDSWDDLSDSWHESWDDISERFDK
ncbi:putative PurR-regulated permease PerM [Enterococcus sp. PF1-24]|uniref:hypothetical protein n=1 Tax=unclassified Enterococcus TaxID=2608891 RepID=UPI002475DA99|nr:MULTISPECIES: hypothetical protein [unclassified Enterococcus]MDH6365703.1 putative PurR-regulated permease PerM [Enterococcus sp. PFB1-1]MDH6402797.1 putative PurR-regulated permease PerM [Enterococcus sp. PF1-24]